MQDQIGVPTAWKLAVLGCSVLCSQHIVAEPIDVYRSVDSHGVVQFSDTRLSDSDGHFQLAVIDPEPAAIEAQDRLFEQQLELIRMLEDSRHSRTQQDLERRRQSVELARARLALQTERNAANSYDDDSYGRAYGYLTPVSYRYERRSRYGNHRRYGSGHGDSGYGSGYRPGGRPGHLPSPGYGNRPGHGGGHGRPGRGGSRTISKPFITN